MLHENALDYRTKRYGNGLMTESFKSFSEFVPRAKNKSNCKNVCPKEKYKQGPSVRPTNTE